MNTDTAVWTPDSWRTKEALQQPTYPDANEFEAVVDRLSTLPPLVTSWEVERLKQMLGEAGAGRRFLLQGGDCAESFDEVKSDTIAGRLKVLLQMSLVLLQGMRKPVVRVGRFAGQYAKPRSSDLETIDGVTLPSYRGDIVNLPAFTSDARTPDPNLMLAAHSYSALTLNFIRSLADGGFADLHHPEYWNLDFAQDSPYRDDYQAIVDRIRDAINFFESVTDTQLANFDRVDFYTSHEALLLPYEAALTRTVPRRRGYYNLSTHMPWIGMRTAQPDGAHVEYARGIRNPVGVKIGPGMTRAWLRDLLRILNPEHEAGRLVLITRLGVDGVEDLLPMFIETVQAEGTPVAWVSDPMHGNTEKTAQGIKTRHFDNILGELEQVLDVHARMGTHLGGVHFELTGEDVTECMGGARNLTADDLERAYKSQVDPRLNAEQALEMAFLVLQKHQRMQG